ncbi:RHO1 GDP-GTP exchange protein 2 [Entomophthora muscae]|uniref:RHO1 GDP-GTP exchange protein 2 n=1 Tax=Entomophthora muscae TaxID=34485 RepID=A0ACC2SGN5_9FUNG|nr:RHO1 GDP-GTP exchange protein 2 [Entomophthora muscae]
MSNPSPRIVKATRSISNPGPAPPLPARPHTIFADEDTLSPPPLPSRPKQLSTEIDSVIELYSNLNNSQSSMNSYHHLSKKSNDSKFTIEAGQDLPEELPSNRISILDRPDKIHLRPFLQKRTSISRLTMLGMDSQIRRIEIVDQTGLLSDIVGRFKRTSQEVMTGTQILDYLEMAACIPLKERFLSLLMCDAMEKYGIFSHTGEDELHVKDGDEEIYVVNINRLQSPSFSPKSVLTYLTRCYFPTCTADRPCSSLSCPSKKLFYSRKMENYKVMNDTSDPEHPAINHPRILNGFDSTLSSDSETLASIRPSTDSRSDKKIKEPELWIESVPPEVSEAVSDDEKKRQELIFETIKTEEDFVKDMSLIEKIFVVNMRQSDVYDRNRVDAVLSTLFSNYEEILAVNRELLEGLKECQAREYVIGSIGEVFLGWALNLDSYVHYGSRLAYAQDFIKKEIEYNPNFAQYLRDCERHPEARRLSIQSFVGRATTRLGRYPLLLQGILKKTKEGSPDLVLIPQVLEFIKTKLEEVNRMAGEAEERLKINFINSHLFFKPEDITLDIDLENKSRHLVKEGILKRAYSHGSQTIAVFLFDNVLILAKEKKKVVVEYRAVCPAIPVYAMDIVDEVSSKSFRIADSLLLTQKAPVEASTLNNNTDTNSFGFSVTHHGRKSMTHYLLATSSKERSQWVEALQSVYEASPQALTAIVQIKDFYQTQTSQNHITATTQCKVNGENYYLMGCENGVHLMTGSGALKRIIKSTSRVVQLEALAEYHLLVVLYADKYLMAYHLDVIHDDSGRLTGNPTKISENVNFFRIGHSSEKHLLISAKYHSQKSNFKTMQLVHFASEGKASQRNKLLWQSRRSTGLRVVKKFYVGTIGNGISFLKTKLVIACGPGFEIVDLEALYLNRGIPDRTSSVISENPRFVALFENCTPIAMYRINPSEFLLCYREFGFYVDNNGRPSRGSESALEWDGVPSDFVYAHPHVICFCPNLIEVRQVGNGSLDQIILTTNAQFTNPSEGLRNELHVSDQLTTSGQRFFKLVLGPQLEISYS